MGQKELYQITKEVNASLFHMSGNCALLSSIVMYNLLNERGVFLAAKNTYPVIKGVSLQAASEFLLGQKLTQHDSWAFDIDGLENQIIKCYEKTGEKVFTIQATGYKIPVIGEYKNQGKEFQKKGRPVKVNAHDFPDKRLGKVAPYGIYDGVF